MENNLKMLDLPQGIAIFVLDMHFLYSLIAVGLGAASRISKSKMEKAVASVAAAIVGIGLFLAPVENAQAQGSSVPTITSVDLDDCFSLNCVVNWNWDNIHRWPLGEGVYLDPGSDFVPWEGGYIRVKISRFLGWDLNGRRLFSANDWIEIWVWGGSNSPSDPPVAYVYDSDGSFYYVDLYFDDYWISGPFYPY